MEYSSNQAISGKFYESFANLLVPQNYASQDRLDANKRLQERLPRLLANMPERYEGEYQSTMDLLLGPPQLSAALRLLEIAMYLYSNNFLYFDSTLGGEDAVRRNPFLEWTVQAIPLKTLSNILRTRFPTLQEFQSALFLFGLSANNLDLIKELLKLDVGLQDFVLSSRMPLKVAVMSGKAEIVSLLLNFDPKVISTHSPLDWHQTNLSNRITGEIVRLLINAGANASFFVCESDYDTKVRGPLPFAVDRGDTELVRTLLSIGVDVNAAYFWPGNFKCLRRAAETGQLDMLRLLLEFGANVHAACEGSYFPQSTTFDRRVTATALQSAAATGNIEVVKLLLEAGSNINDPAYGDGGQTALYTATRTGHVHMVEFLLRNGADANAAGTASMEFPRPPLLLAVERHDLPVINILLEYGADPNIAAFSYHGTRILEAARTLRSNPDIISTLVRAGASDVLPQNDSVRDEWMRIQLVQAIVRGDTSRIYYLMKVGKAPDMRPTKLVSKLHSHWSETGDPYMTTGTVLHWAIASEKMDFTTFRRLVSHIRNINDMKDCISMPPYLHDAVSRKQTDFAKILLDAGADVNALYSGRSNLRRFHHILPTALHVAAYNHDSDMVTFLLETGANPDASLPGAGIPLNSLLSGYTASYFGGSDPDLGIFELLLGRFGIPEALEVNTTGFRTVLEQAVQGARSGGGHWMTITRRLLDLGADTNAPAYESDSQVSTALQTACWGSNFNLVELLLDHAADINAPAARGSDTALQAASSSGIIDLVKILVARGAELNAAPSEFNGGTALQLSAKNGHTKVAQYLLAKGADANAPGSKEHGHTALEFAAWHGRLDMVQLLINAGADTNIPRRKRYVSSLLLARDCGRLGVVSLLRKHRDKLREQWDMERVHEVGQDESFGEDSDEVESLSDDDFGSDAEDD